ncbi:MAG: hypothetical protein AAF664_09595 [Planctomycetota bacterium]
MSVKTQCPHCQAQVDVAVTDARAPLMCPVCQKRFRLPADQGGIVEPLDFEGDSFDSAANLKASATEDDADWLSLDSDPPKPTNQPNPADLAPKQSGPAGDEVIQSASKSGVTDEFGGEGASDDLLDDSLDDDFGLMPVTAEGPPKTDSSASVEDYLPEFLDGNQFDEVDLSDLGSNEMAVSPTNVDLGGEDFGATIAPPASVSEINLANAEYRVTCNICGTVIYARASQQGMNLRCEDCHADVLVPPPPADLEQQVAREIEKKRLSEERKRKREAGESPALEEKPLSPIFAATATATANTKSSKDEKDLRQEDPFRKRADQYLAEAEAEDEEEEEEDWETPDMKVWLQEVFGVLGDIGVIAHVAAFTLLLSLPIYFGVLMDNLITLICIVPLIFGIAVLVACCGLAVMQSVSGGAKRVEQWPSFAPTEWLGEAFMLAIALAMPLAPVSALVVPFVGINLLSIVAAMFSVFLLFPFILLSMLDQGSPWIPFSAEVARGVSRNKETWGAMYFSSALIFFALFLIYVICFTVAEVSMIFVGVAATVAVSFVYFAMIGRLARSMGQ